MTHQKFETGASTHAVNDLILFADNTRELAEIRNSIYQSFADDAEGQEPTAYDFGPLYRAAKEAYIKEFRHANSLHIIQMTYEEVAEFCQLYANEFENWKSENL